MNADKIPAPIIAAQPTTATIRQAAEECANVLDAAGARTASITEAPVVLPTGEIATLRCTRNKRGDERILITILRAAK
jgi:enamine deaminase RidA (YjgF/YER057c/UK114 family)